MVLTVSFGTKVAVIVCESVWPVQYETGRLGSVWQMNFERE